MSADLLILALSTLALFVAVHVVREWMQDMETVPELSTPLTAWERIGRAFAAREPGGAGPSAAVRAVTAPSP